MRLDCHTDRRAPGKRKIPFDLHTLCKITERCKGTGGEAPEKTSPVLLLASSALHWHIANRFRVTSHAYRLATSRNHGIIADPRGAKEVPATDGKSLLPSEKARARMKPRLLSRGTFL